MARITREIAEAVHALRQGEAVAIPTETVYGLAARAFNEEAVKRVYALKDRPTSHPLIIHVHPHFPLMNLVETISPLAKRLMNQFWPGPLTLVFRRNPKQVLDCVTGGQSTVAIRCPAHPLTQAILEAVGEPLVAPSANPFGKVSPTTAEHVLESFIDEPLLIMDGGRCEMGIESTIVSVVEEKGVLLRPGAIDSQKLSAFLGGTDEHYSIRTPGRLKHHYQPHKPITAFENRASLLEAYQSKPKPIYVLSYERNEVFDDRYFFQLPSHPQQMEYELYFQLRLADRSDALEILIALPPAEPEWAALRDRILKASA